MSTLWIIVVLVFVVSVLAVVTYAMFEMSPFAHHVDRFRDTRSGRRLWESPHLETRDEFEQTHEA